MPTADEMLATTVEEQHIFVDLNTRQLNIPKSITNLGVESDDDVLRLPFKMPRYLGEFDLSEFTVRINYLNARKLGDLFEPDDVEVTEDDMLTFTWLVGRYAASYKGNVSFNVCLKKYDEADPAVVVKEFNSTIAILPILEGLETGEAIVADYLDVLEAWKTELFDIYDNIKDAVDDYIESLGVSSVVSVNGKTGAVNLTHEDVGAAPDGLITSGTIVVASEEELEAALSERFAAMSDKTVRYFYINATSSNIFGGKGTQCELSRWIGSEGGFGFARFASYNKPATSISYKTLYGGVWQPMENASTDAFAPSGYGLGDISKVLTGEDNLNNMSINGWYSWGDTSPMNAPVWNAFGGTGYAYMRIDNSYDGSCVQTVYNRMDGLSNIVQMRTCTEGVWSEWEWINPPMEAGIEYRTTDRIDGKAVYKKNVDGVIHYRLDGETEWKPYSKAVGAAVVTCTAWLDWDGWSSTAPYTQTVSAPGVLASDTPLVDIRFLDSDTTTSSLARLEAWACIDRVVAGDGTLTLYAYEEKPGEGFSINVMVVR